MTTPRQIARRKRQRFTPDTRPRWDDPDLCVYTKKGEPKPADLLTAFCQAELRCKSEFMFPSWRNDPTYFMGKRHDAAAGKKLPINRVALIAPCVQCGEKISEPRRRMRAKFCCDACKVTFSNAKRRAKKGQQKKQREATSK
jgi:hypothetical protein